MDALERGTDNNPDGHGWAIVLPDAQQIVVGHSMIADEALTQFEIARKALPAGPALFHSRIATAGEVTTYNTHPFYVGGDRRTVLAHNGILPSDAQPGKGETRSDTHLLADKWIPKRRFGHFWSRKGRKRLAKWCGYGNKLVLLTVDDAYTQYSYIINEHAGDWHGNIWYSNDSWNREPWWMHPKYQSKYASSYTAWWDDTDVTVIGTRALDASKSGTESTSKELVPVPSSEEACQFCLAKGYISDVTYMCWCCHTCQLCARGFDNCRCSNRPEFADFQFTDSDDDMKRVMNGDNLAEWTESGFSIIANPELPE
jgi:glutamine amidotransferase